MSKSKIFDIYTFLSNIPKAQYFIDVINTSTMEGGIINLMKEQ